MKQLYYKKKDIEENQFFADILLTVMIGLPILFMPKYLIAIYFMFWVGNMNIAINQYEKFEKEDEEK